jgi:hypothetical protein
LQSQAYELFYLANTAIPSLAEVIFNGAIANDVKYARDGNSRALQYFSKYYYNGGVANWNFNLGINGGNPITGYNPGLSSLDPINQAALKANERSIF